MKSINSDRRRTDDPRKRAHGKVDLKSPRKELGDWDKAVLRRGRSITIVSRRDVPSRSQMRIAHHRERRVRSRARVANDRR